MIKTIFTDILSRLDAEVPALKYISMDTGQLLAPDQSGRYPVNWPCALIDVQIPRAESQDAQRKLQEANLSITIKVGFDFTGNTTSDMSEEHLAQSLAYLDTVQAVYEKLQGYKTTNFRPLTRVRQVDEKRGDAIKVTVLQFTSSFRDSSADS